MELPRFKPGDRVNYKHIDGRRENGIVKKCTNQICTYVVFKCGGDWEHYESYTAEACQDWLLSPGWWSNDIDEELYTEPVKELMTKALNDERVSTIDFQILQIAARHEANEVDAMSAFEELQPNESERHPIVQEDMAEKDYYPKLKRLVKLGYLTSYKQEYLPKIYKSFWLNLNPPE